MTLARKMARDGEGASKLLECRVQGARSKEDARKIAKSVICSSLFKAAMFGADANWGRVLCAVVIPGRCERGAGGRGLHLKMGRIQVCLNGAGVPFSEEEAKRILSEPEIIVLITLHEGDAQAQAYGCDLTYDYVKINGDYRS